MAKKTKKDTREPRSRKLLTSSKLRVKHWKRMMKVQASQAKRGVNNNLGKPIKRIKKGSDEWNQIMELAREDSDHVVEIAEEFFGDVVGELPKLVQIYNKGNLKTQTRKEGRQDVKIQLGFKKRSPFIGNQIRIILINDIRGVIVRKRKAKTPRKKKSAKKGKVPKGLIPIESEKPKKRKGKKKSKKKGKKSVKARKGKKSKKSRSSTKKRSRKTKKRK